jgi:hypothetical protein
MWPFVFSLFKLFTHNFLKFPEHSCNGCSEVFGKSDILTLSQVVSVACFFCLSVYDLHSPVSLHDSKIFVETGHFR